MAGATGMRLLALGGAGVGFGLGLAGLIALQTLLPPPRAADLAQRIALALLALLPGVGVFGLMIAAQMALRFATAAFDLTAGADGPVLQRTQRVIANTVEQLALFAPALLALAAIEPAAVDAVPAFGLVFAAARLAFWIGYTVHPLARAPGMAASTLCSFGAAGWAGLAWAGLA